MSEKTAEKTDVATAAKTSHPLPTALTIQHAQKLFGDKEGETVYHNIARAFGFGDFRRETFASGLPPLDLTGLSDADRTRAEKMFASGGD